MTAQFARTPYRGRSGGSTIHEPHAALLIDFDNVTMGIRSDLTKELKNLLNSDIIKGKVAVQRAYADWRRYPQYIVPLAESSVDLIFAPAYGSAKKNATDIRLAIDAVELVFTRPEIGTIILLSGDSDFSSLVLKLKEYGKYVIGVGIRESASDLLVQNCDEYYSYSALTGLTRAGDEAPAVSEDPWELVDMALRQMIENDDVMRSDRLKQVLLERDPAFDEKALGFQKFNKFLQEAANRGLLALRKQENGQYEVGPPSAEAVEAAADQARGDSRESREGRSRRGRRGGRGRREEREPREVREVREVREHADGATAAAEQPTEDQRAALQLLQEEEAPATREPAAAADALTPAAADGAASAESDLAATAAAVDTGAAAAARIPARREPRKVEQEPVVGGITDGVAASYDLLRKAVSDLTRKSGPAVRDSDVKRRMLELQPGWDEAGLGFSKFSRFLRTAHESEIITLRKGENGVYDVLLGDGGVHVAEGREERGGRRDRERGRGRSRDVPGRREAPEPREAAVATKATAESATVGATVGATKASAESAAVGATQATAPAPAAKAAPVEPAAPAAARPASAVTQAPGSAVGFRRGSRGRTPAAGPPPLLEGQTARVPKPTGEDAAAPRDAAAAAATAAAVAEQPTAAEQPVGGQPAARRRSRGRKTDAAVAAEKPAAKAGKPAAAAAEKPPAGVPPKPAAAVAEKPAPAVAAKPAAPAAGGRPAKRAGEGGRGGRPQGREAAAKTPRPAVRLDPAALRLPSTPADMVAYMASAYSGVGPKSVQSLIDAVGAPRLYEVLNTQHDRVREVLGARGDRLIEAFADDVAARRANAAPDSRSVLAQQTTGGGSGPRKGGGRPRGRVAGRKPPPRK
jgi:uncharacterized protein (TIGR00288 family)